MKKISMLLTGVLFSTAMFAGGAVNEASKVSVKKENENTFNLTYKTEKPTNVNVSIVNGDGQTIFSESIKNTEGFMRPYNFTGLEKGIYTIEISDEFGERTELVDFRTVKTEKLINVKRIAEGDKFLFTAAGNGEEEITINIYDASNTLIHTDTKLTEGNFGQVYNLGKLGESVKFEITSQYGTKTVRY